MENELQNSSEAGIIMKWVFCEFKIPKFHEYLLIYEFRMKRKIV